MEPTDPPPTNNFDAVEPMVAEAGGAGGAGGEVGLTEHQRELVKQYKVILMTHQ